MTRSVIPLLVAALLAACAGSSSKMAIADPQIAGRTYPGKAIPFGPLRGTLEARGPVEDPSRLELLVGFRSTGGAEASIVVTGQLLWGAARAPAEVAARRRVAGTAQGCPWEPGAELSTEYLFNGRVAQEQWSCAWVEFRTPGRTAADALELVLDPISVAGDPVRVLPITLVPRSAQ